MQAPPVGQVAPEIGADTGQLGAAQPGAESFALTANTARARRDSPGELGPREPVRTVGVPCRETRRAARRGC